jgi:hypothetical protein
MPDVSSTYNSPAHKIAWGGFTLLSKSNYNFVLENTKSTNSTVFVPAGSSTGSEELLIRTRKEDGNGGCLIGTDPECGRSSLPPFYIDSTLNRW